MRSTENQSVEADKQYFVTRWGTRCEDYADSKSDVFLATGETSKQCPPEILTKILKIQTIEQIPDEYRSLLQK